MIFFDTNVVVYAYSVDPRRARAQEILAEGGLISAQVLNEFSNVARKKHRRSWPDIRVAVATIREQVDDVLPLTAETHARALDVAERHGVPFYDALIVAAALEGRCTTLFSEDFQNGQVIDGLTITNPFA